MTLDAPKNIATLDMEEKPNTWHAVPKPKRRARRTQRLLAGRGRGRVLPISLPLSVVRLSTWPAAVAAVVAAAAAAAPKSNCALFCRQRRTQFFFRPPSSSPPNSSRNHHRHVRVPHGKTGRRHRRPPHEVSCADNVLFTPNSRFGRSASLGHFLFAVGEIRSDTSPR